jgi:hypothetical protein
MGNEEDEFAWLLDDYRRRSALRNVLQSVRHGWLNGTAKAAKRAALSATLDRVARRKLSKREAETLAEIRIALQARPT